MKLQQRGGNSLRFRHTLESGAKAGFRAFGIVTIWQPNDEAVPYLESNRTDLKEIVVPIFPGTCQGNYAAQIHVCAPSCANETRTQAASRR